MPECPATLDAAAQGHWERIALQLTNTLTPIDGPALAILCSLLADFERAGTAQERVALTRVIQPLARQFGMMPLARGVKPTDPIDPDDDESHLKIV